MMKPTNGSTLGDRGDMMTLLDSSDSDVEWLNLPPIKGKKPRRKKTYKSPNAAAPVCSLWVFMKILLVLFITAMMIVLIIITYSLMSQVADLRDQMKQAQSRTDGSVDDIHKLLGQLQEVNKTVHGFRAGNQGLDVAFGNISSISEKLLLLKGSVDKLNKGFDAAPELKDLPDRVQTISTTVAAIGSTVDGMKDKVEVLGNFQKNVQTSMDSLNSQVSALQTSMEGLTGSREGGSGGLELLGTLQDLIKSTNETMSNKVSLVTIKLDEQETHLALLDNVTTQLEEDLSQVTSMVKQLGAGPESVGATVDYSSEEFKSHVEDIVHEVLQTSVGGSGASEGGNVSQLDRDTIKNLTTIVSMIQERINSTMGLNTTVVQLNSDVDHLSSIVFKDASQLSSLQSEVDRIKGFLANQGQSLPTVDVPKTQSPTVSTDQTTEVTSTAGSSQTPSSTDSNNNNTTVATEGEHELTVEPPTQSPHLSIPNIGNAANLTLNFHRWDKRGVGKVAYDVLPGHIGETHTPPEEELQKYDKNGDNMYSLEEFAAALGIDLGTQAALSSSTSAP